MHGPARPLAALAAGVVLLAGCGKGGNKDEQESVPSVVGQRAGVAVEILRDDDFEARTRRVRDVRARDHVLRQSPAAGTKADKGATVTVTVSAGPGEGRVPDVAELGADDAERTLREAGFVAQPSESFSAAVPAGVAIGTSPAAGARRERDTPVTLELSRGPQEVAVPDVLGDPEATALRTLRAARFDVLVTPRQDKRDPGAILGQEPSGGVSVPVGSSVRLVVDRAPKRVTVPDVVGDAQQAASTTVSRAGLPVAFRTREVRQAARDGLVLAQSPAAGAQVTEGEAVVLTVGKASKPPPVPPPPTPPPPSTRTITRTYGLLPDSRRTYTATYSASTCPNADPRAKLVASPPAASTSGAEITTQGGAGGPGVGGYYATVRTADITPGTLQLVITIRCPAR
jgi:eukaryotic-like serine/threonine-protein kinase